MTYARSFICRPARFLKGRLVFQADYLLVRLPITKPTISRHTLYNSGRPLSSIIRSPDLHAYSPPSSICLDRHRSSVYRAHGWTASHQLYQEFGISEFLYSLQLSFVNLSFVVIFHCVLFSYIMMSYITFKAKSSNRISHPTRPAYHWTTKWSLCITLCSLYTWSSH